MNVKEIENKRIAVLLSGGVDSSVVLYELVRQGLHPDCFYIKIGPEEEEEWDCSSEEDLEMATAVSHKYGCKLEVIDCHKEYWDQVTTYTMDKVRAGMTPNPDVMCNRLIKFGAFHEKCGHDYDLIATGHYATTEEETISNLPLAVSQKPKAKSQKLKWLCTSPDPVKDQTDFLAQIYDWQLAKALFPIGHMMKDEVRVIAEREHLVNAKRKDSQGICFLGKINYNDYLRRYLATWWNWKQAKKSVSTKATGSTPSVSARVWDWVVVLGSSSRKTSNRTSSMCLTATTLRQPISRTFLLWTSTASTDNCPQRISR